MHGRSDSLSAGGFARLALIGALLASATGVGAAQLPSLVAPVQRIGAADLPEEEVFGRILDVGVDAAGHVFVLDGMVAEVRWFGPDGRLLGRAGRRGGGPGEFAHPQGMAVDAAGRVHVLDAAQRRITVFETTAQGLLLVKELEVPPPATTLCALGERLFVLMPLADGVLHEIDRGGRVLRSFGALEDPPAERRRGEAGPVSDRVNNHGWLACDARSQRIVLLHERLPIVRAFSPDGAPLWRTTLSDYSEVQWTRTPTGGWQMRANPATGRAHTGVAVAVTDGGRLFVTLHSGGLVPGSQRLELRELRLADGLEIARGPTPIRITAARGEHLYGHTDDPYPRIEVYRAGSR